MGTRQVDGRVDTFDSPASDGGGAPGLSPLMALEPEALRCPYALYGAARREGLSFDDSAQAFVVSRFGDAVAVLRDGAGFSSTEVLGRPLPPPDALAGQVPPLLLVSDDPEHAKKRAIVARAFTPRQMRRFEPVVRELCDQLIDKMLAKATGTGTGEAGSVADGVVDFVAELAAPLPIRVITAVLGVPSGDADTFRHWSEEVTRSLGGQDVSPEARQVASESFRALVDGLFESPEALEGDSVMAIVAEAEAAGELTRFEAVRLVMELIVAGNITTTDHLANSMVLLDAHPEVVERLRAEPSLVAAFVEESLRLEAPAQAFYRRSTADREVGGVEVPAGSRMLVLYGSANRDEERFAEPGELRLDRESPASHLAFGFGSHTCIGAPLARLEGRIAVEALLEATSSFSVVATEPVEYLASFINHGPVHLPVRFERAHAEPAHAEPAHAEPAHAEPAHAEPAHVEPAQRAVAATAPGAARRG